MSEDVQVELQAADIHVLHRSVAESRQPVTSGLYWLLRISIWAALVIASVFYPLIWLVVAAEAGVVAIEIQNRRRLTQSEMYRVLNGRYRVDDVGLHRLSNSMESLTRWHAIDRVTQTGTHLIVRFGGTAWVIPFRCFDSDDTRKRFTDMLTTHAPSRPPPT